MHPALAVAATPRSRTFAAVIPFQKPKGQIKLSTGRQMDRRRAPTRKLEGSLSFTDPEEHKTLYVQAARTRIALLLPPEFKSEIAVSPVSHPLAL